MRFHLTAANNNLLHHLTMRFFRIILISRLIPINTGAQQFPKPMDPPRLVNDFTGFLTEQENNDLNNKLSDFGRETSTQICVVTYDDLQGYDIDDYGDRLGQNWGIGQQGKNNGILI